MQSLDSQTFHAHRAGGVHRVVYLAWLASLIGMPCLSLAQSIDFITPNHSLADLELSMSNYYLRLERDGQLPVQPILDSRGSTPQDLMYSLGLIKGQEGKLQFPQELAGLLQRLNPGLWRKRADGSIQWLNKAGDTLCLPAVRWQNALTLVRVKLPTAGDPVLTLDRSYGTCAALGEACREKVMARVTSPGKDGTVAIAGLAQAAIAWNGPTECSPVRASNTSSKSPETVWRPTTNQLNAPLLPKQDKKAEARKPVPSGEWGTSPLTAPKTSATERWSTATKSRSEDDQNAKNAVYSSVERPIELETENAAATPMEAIARSPVLAEAPPPITPKPTPAKPSPAMPTPMPEPIEVAASAGHSDEPGSSDDSESIQTPEQVGVPATSIPVASLENSALHEAGLDELRLPGAAEHTIGVLVFDTKVNGCHFVLRKHLARNCSDQALPETYWVMPEPSVYENHGSHISGIIAGDGIGIHPGAKITFVSFKLGSVFDSKREQQVVDSLFDADPRTVRVANFSLDLNTTDLALRNLFATHLASVREVLIVAAAGDQPGSLNDGCQTVPACLSMGDSDNLLVVGGALRTNGQWGLWPNTSFGQKVHVLAPAVGAVSAVLGNGWIGTLNGTSQSAAIVSGLAARLFEKQAPPASNWYPAQVRNRLMATGHITTATLKWSQSGVVNGDRALDTEKQVLRFKSAAGEQELHGKLLKIVDAKSGERAKTDVAFTLIDGKDVSFDYCHFYRVSKLGSDNNWALVYQLPGEGSARWTDIKIYVGAILATSGRALQFQEEHSSTAILVPLEDVLDFYDSFSGKLACPEYHPF